MRLFESGRSIQVLGVLLLIPGLLMFAAPQAKADVVFDTDSNDATSSVSQVQDGDEIADPYEANASKSFIVQVAGINGSDHRAEIIDNDTGMVLATNASMVNVSTTRPSEGAHFNGTFTHDEFAEVERTTGENVTLDIRVEESSNASNNTVIQAYIEGNNDTVYHADNDSSGTDIFAEENTLFDTNIAYLNPVDYTAVETDRDVNGSDSDVYVVLNDSTAATDFDNAFGSASAGDWTPAALATVEGTPVKTYYREAPSSVSADDTYAVYQPNGLGGEDVVQFNLGSEYDDADDVEVGVQSTATVPTLIDAYGTEYITSWAWVPSMSLLPIGSSGLGASLFLFGTVKRRQTGA